MKEPQSETVSMQGRVCIVTGANSGVGREAAAQLARRGAHLVMVCRNREKAEEARTGVEAGAAGPVDLVLADLARLEEVRRLAGILLERYRKIHVLVNNAGVFYTQRTTTADGFETMFAVNYLAVFLLTRLLVDRLKAGAPARIVNVVSKGHRFGDLDLNDLHWEKRKFRGLKSYGASKIAGILFVRELARRLEGSGVTCNCLHPGEVVTRIGVDNNGRTYNAVKRVLLDRLYRTPVTAAGEAVCALAASPALAEVTGAYFELEQRKTPSPAACDASLGRTLWLLSEQFTGLVTPTAPV